MMEVMMEAEIEATRKYCTGILLCTCRSYRYIIVHMQVATASTCRACHVSACRLTPHGCTVLAITC